MEERIICTIDTAALYKNRQQPIAIDLNASYKIHKQEGQPGGLYLDHEQHKALARLLCGPSYNIQEFIVPHTCAITSLDELMYALNRNATITLVTSEPREDWLEITTEKTSDNKEILTQILTRNYFLAQTQNREHFTAFQHIVTASTKDQLATALTHAFPSELSQQCKDTLPFSLQKLAEEKNGKNISELFACFVAPAHQVALDYIASLYEQEDFVRKPNDLMHHKQHLLEVALRRGDRVTIEYALRICRAHNKIFPNDTFNFDKKGDFLEFISANIEAFFQNDSCLIVEVLLLILQEKSPLFFLRLEHPPQEQPAKLALKIISLLIKHAGETQLESSIAITNQLIEEIVLSEEINSEKKLALLQDSTEQIMEAILSAPTTLEENTDQQRHPWQDTLEKLFDLAIGIEKIKNTYSHYEHYQEKLVVHASQSTNPKALDLVFEFYARAHQSDTDFHFPIYLETWHPLFTILNSQYFTLGQKRQTIQMALYQQEPKAESLLLRTDLNKLTNHHREKSLLSLLIELHIDSFGDLIAFIKGLPSYEKIRTMLRSDMQLINQACSASAEDRGALVTATVALYSATSIELNIPSSYRKGMTFTEQMKLFLCNEAIDGNVKLNLLSLILLNKTLKQTSEILFHRGNTFLSILRADNNDCLSAFIHSHTLSYSDQEGFSHLWQRYTELSLRMLREDLTHYRAKEDENYDLPKALKLLDPEEWVETFFNLSSTESRSVTLLLGYPELLPGNLQPGTLHNVHGDSFSELTLPYLLLAHGMYFKTRERQLAYANRAAIFIDRVDVLLGNKAFTEDQRYLLDSTFSRLYQQLPKQAFFTEEEKKIAFTFLYNFCNNQYDNSSTAQFQTLIIHPLLEKLSPLFARATAKVSTHEFDDEERDDARDKNSIGRKADATPIYSNPENHQMYYQMVEINPPVPDNHLKYPGG